MAKAERTVLQQVSFTEDDFNAEQQAIMSELRAVWTMQKELNAKLAATFAALGPAGADVVISHKPWDKKITWLAPVASKAKADKPKQSLADFLAQSASNGHAV